MAITPVVDPSIAQATTPVHTPMTNVRTYVMRDSAALARAASRGDARREALTALTASV
jgi:hypothetical protein